MTITGGFAFSAAEDRRVDAYGLSSELVLQASLCFLWEECFGDVRPRRSGREQGRGETEYVAEPGTNFGIEIWLSSWISHGIDDKNRRGKAWGRPHSEERRSGRGNESLESKRIARE